MLIGPAAKNKEIEQFRAKCWPIQATHRSADIVAVFVLDVHRWRHRRATSICACSCFPREVRLVLGVDAGRARGGFAGRQLQGGGTKDTWVVD